MSITAKFNQKKFRYPFFASIILLLVYIVGGFWVVPAIVQTVLPKMMKERFHLTITVEDINLNPFTFSVDVRGLAIRQGNDDPFFKFGYIQADFQIWSILNTPYHIKSLQIVSPEGQIQKLPDGHFSLMPLLKLISMQKEGGNDGQKIPAIMIDRINFEQGKFTFIDLSRSSPFVVKVVPFSAVLTGVNTEKGEEGRFSAKMAIENMGRIETHGHFSTNPTKLRGRLEIGSFRLRPLWEYIQDRVRFEIDDGSIGIESEYDAEIKDDQLMLKIKDGSFKTNGFRLSEKGENINLISVPDLNITGINFDQEKRTLDVEAITISEAEIFGWLNPDGAFKLTNMFSMAPAENITELPSNVERGNFTDNMEGWQVNLQRTEIKNAVLRYEDRTLQPAVKILLKPVNVKVKGVSYPQPGNVSVAMSAIDEQGGSINVTGSASMQPASADITFNLNRLSLLQFQPILDAATRLKLESGTLSMKGRVNMPPKGNAPKFRLDGDMKVNDVKIHEAGSEDILFQQEELSMNGIQFEVAPNQLTVDKIIDRYSEAHLVIEPEGSTNFHRVILLEAEDVKKLENSLLGQLFNSILLQIKGPFPVQIDSVLMENGKVSITDRSLQPSFRLSADSINAKIINIDSKAGDEADLFINGIIDGDAPFEAKGQVDPFGKDVAHDMEISLKNYNLIHVAPYSAKFLGYTLKRGKMTADIDYLVEKNYVTGQNEILIQQLVLGKKTDGPDVIDLPLEMTVAIMQDRKGDLRLDMPIEGNLNDPEFSVGSLVGDILIRLVDFTVKSPFAVLGGIAGGFSANELQQVNFRPNSSELDNPEKQKLSQLALSLKERPLLILGIEGTASSKLDQTAGETNLMSLAEKRAEAVKGFLIKESKIDAGRLFVVRPVLKDSNSNNSVPVVLSLSKR